MTTWIGPEVLSEDGRAGEGWIPIRSAAPRTAPSDRSRDTPPRLRSGGFSIGPEAIVLFSPRATCNRAVLVRKETAVRIWDLAALRTRLAGMRLDWDEDERPVPEGRQE
jgi:hypothetical protein